MARDERFDGRFFVGVTSTGIYCRPICPASTARRRNCRFFVSAAAAQQAGFRPCLRCRPDRAPELAGWRGSSSSVARGLDLIAAGALDSDGANVDRLAERLGIGARHLRRLFLRHLGASPIAVAQTRRVLLANQLIQDTRLPLGEIALASGFGSVRRFNEAFQCLYQRPPSALRARAAACLPAGSMGAAGVTVRLPYRPPYDWTAMLAHLAARTIAGVEFVDADGGYNRTFCERGQTGTVRVAHLPEAHGLTATVRCSDVRALPGVVNRVRRGFDVDADVDIIGAHLGCDPILAPLVAQRPGLRVPGGWDGFEVAVRAVLGQQVSVSAACRLVSRLTERCGSPTLIAQQSLLRWSFPTARQVLGADLAGLGIPAARVAALAAVARNAEADPLLFHPLATIEETVARLCLIPGVGEWTAHVIALRAARDADAFPVGDAGLRRGAAALLGPGFAPGALARRAERWRPWRAYAAQHLWTNDGTTSPQTQENVHGSQP